MILYVDANASRDGNGSASMPFRHINDAAQTAVAGDEILVAPGIYREKVTSSPSVSGALFPMNCFVKVSSAQHLPRPAVWVAASTFRDAIAPFPSVVTVTVISLLS